MNNIYDVIIIGAGPAGLTAAIYLARANKKVLVFEANSYGGAIVNSQCIANYPACPNITGFDFANKLYHQAKDLGTSVVFEKVLNIKNGKVKTVITKKAKYLAKSLIIATGLKYRRLGLEKEDDFVGKGISYCATCDGNFFKGKKVIVVGGGNTALEDALYLSDIAKEVYLIHRRDRFKAFEKTISLVKAKPNVHLILNSTVTKLLGTNNLEGVEVLIDKKETKKIVAEGLFIAIGQDPETLVFEKIIKTNQDGYILDKNSHTNRKGIFVAGDVREKSVRQLVGATSDGCLAAIEAINFLNRE